MYSLWISDCFHGCRRERHFCFRSFTSNIETESCVKSHPTINEPSRQTRQLECFRTPSLPAWRLSSPSLVEEYFLWKKEKKHEVNDPWLMFLNIHLHVFSNLAAPRNILRRYFWRAEAVLRHSLPPSPRHPSGIKPWKGQKTALTGLKAGCTRHKRLSSTCPLERNPSAQLLTCPQHGADLQTG